MRIASARPWRVRNAVVLACGEEPLKHARDRRQGGDRRQADTHRPTLRERRRVADRRSLQVQEITYEEWVAQAIEHRNQRLRTAKAAQARAKTAGARHHRQRAALDRRQADDGPPAGRRERRHLGERRGLEVREISYAEFLKLLRGDE